MLVCAEPWLRAGGTAAGAWVWCVSRPLVRQSALDDFASTPPRLSSFHAGTSTYLRAQRPSLFQVKTGGPSGNELQRPTGLFGLVYKASVIGTRLSPYVSLSCVLMATCVLFL